MRCKGCLKSLNDQEIHYNVSISVESSNQNIISNKFDFNKDVKSLLNKLNKEVKESIENDVYSNHKFKLCRTCYKIYNMDPLNFKINNEIANYRTDKGAYIIVFKIKKSIEKKIGALGKFKFEEGIYFYVGSAMKNLTKRVMRHLRKEKKIKWHIDYLLADSNVDIVNFVKIQSENKIECELNQRIHKLLKSDFPIKRFGSSDCNCCVSHLQKI